MTDIVGITRFSVLTHANKAAWNCGRGGSSLEEMEKIVFSPKRLRRRFELFEHWTLPSIREMKEAHVLMASDHLPVPYKARLSKNLPGNVDIVYLSVDDDYVQVADVIAQEYDFNFRLDDDDWLSPSYPSLVRKLYQSGKVLSF